MSVSIGTVSGMFLRDDEQTPTVPGAAAALTPFIKAGVVGRVAAHFVSRACPSESFEVQLGAALAVEAVLRSDTCLRLSDAVERFAPDGVAAAGANEPDDEDRPTGDVVQPELPWPSDAAETDAPAALLEWPARIQWLTALGTSDVVDPTGDPDLATPLVLIDDLLFLRRFWLDERQIAGVLHDLVAHGRETAQLGGEAPTELADALFPAHPGDEQNSPRSAATNILRRRLGVLVGGPGTGKTRTIARVLALLWLTDPDLTVALAAPTGKAAQRMKEAIVAAGADLRNDELPGVTDEQLDALLVRLAEAEPQTIHRLLGLRPGEQPRRNEASPLQHDIVVIDEASMMSLPLTADLVRSLADTTRLLLVGDPHQLASVEAGAILGDLVDDRTVTRSAVTELTVNHRSIPELDALFRATRDGDADAVIELCRGGTEAINWIEIDERAPSVDLDASLETLISTLEPDVVALTSAARTGDANAALAALHRSKVLCSTRRGRLGVAGWTDRLERLVVTDRSRRRRWYPGRPVIITRNDPINRLFNGDVGITTTDGVVFDGAETRRFAPTQLAEHETWWAMTVHKSQGSEFDHAVVSLGRATAIDTRELLYTAVTRARQKVTIVASEATLRATVARRVERISGLSSILS